MQRSGTPILKDMYVYSAILPAEEVEFLRNTSCLLFIENHEVGMRLTINRISRKLKGLGCIFLPPNTALRIHTADSENLRPIKPIRFYVCEYQWIAEETSDDLAPEPMLAEPNGSGLFEQASLLHDSYKNRMHNGLSQRLPLQAQFLMLFANASWAFEQPDSISFAKPLDGIDRVISYLHDCYDRKISRDDVVSLSGLSLRQFTSSFKRRTGLTFVEYLNRIRIDQVKSIMLQSRKSLNEVARQVGYADEFYLSRKFKQATGISPTLYLRKPRTIASLDHAYTLDLLSLGVTPCAAITDTWVNEQFRPSGSFHPLYWQTDSAKRLQVLRHVKPDIILYPLTETNECRQLEQYRQIGLVVQIPWRGINWRQHFMNVAQLTDSEHKANDWLDYFDHRAGAVRESLRRVLDPSATVAVINVRSDRMLIYAYGYMGADLLYDTLKIAPPQAVIAMRLQGLEHPEFTVSQLPDYDADHYFVAIENSQAARHRAAAMMRSPEWTARTAVQRRCVYPVDMTKWYGYGPAALDAQLDDVVHYLLPNCPNKHGPI